MNELTRQDRSFYAAVCSVVVLIMMILLQLLYYSKNDTWLFVVKICTELKNHYIHMMKIIWLNHTASCTKTVIDVTPSIMQSKTPTECWYFNAPKIKLPLCWVKIECPSKKLVNCYWTFLCENLVTVCQTF